MSIYKYVIADRIDILENSRIRFTQPSALNDPFEMQPFIIAFAEESKLIEEYEQILGSEIEQYRSQSLDDKRESTNWQEQRNELLQFGIEKLHHYEKSKMPMLRKAFTSMIQRIVSILSLTKDPYNLIMWAHYAQNHQGFVIEFDESHGFFNQKRHPKDEFGFLREVTYSNERPKVILNNMTPVDLFLVKSKHWKYEKEWRMMLPIMNFNKQVEISDTRIVLAPLPPDCVKGVILGCRISLEKREKLLRLLSSRHEYSHVKKYEAVPDERNFGLNFHEI
jgi:Protein of unknown function (DUF2971)